MLKHGHLAEIHTCVVRRSRSKAEGCRALLPLWRCRSWRLRISISYHAFPSLMAVLGSVFDEEDVGDVQNAPTLTLLCAKLVEIRVLILTWPIVTH